MSLFSTKNACRPEFENRRVFIVLLLTLALVHFAYATPLRLLRSGAYAISKDVWYALAIPGIRAVAPLIALALTCVILAIFAKDWRRRKCVPLSELQSRQKRPYTVRGIISILLALLGFVSLAVSIGTFQVGAWLLSIQLSDLAASRGLPQLCFVVSCVLSVYLSSMLLRFGARFFPLRADGGRDKWSIFVLGTLIVIFTVVIVMAFGAIKQLTAENEPLPYEPKLINLLTLSSQVAREIDKELLRLGVMLTVTLVAPCLWLFASHVRPRAWSSRPFVIFLRRFSGITNTIGLGAMARDIPRGYRVAFLVGAADNVGAWDPYAVGVSGFLWTDPLRSVPVCLRATDANWAHDVRLLLKHAACVVIDSSASSQSMAYEIEMVRELGPEAPVLWISRGAVDPPLQPNNTIEFQKHVIYSTSWYRAIPRILYSGAALLAAGCTLVYLGFVLVSFTIFQGQPDWADSYHIPLYLLAALPLILLGRLVMYPALARDSLREIRHCLGLLCRRNLGRAITPFEIARKVVEVQVLAFASVVSIVSMWDLLRGSIPAGLFGSASWIPLLGGIAALAASARSIWLLGGGVKLTLFAAGLAASLAWTFGVVLQERPVLVIVGQKISSSVHGEPPGVWISYTAHVTARLINTSDRNLQLDDASLILTNVDEDKPTDISYSAFGRFSPSLKLGPRANRKIRFKIESSAHWQLVLRWNGGVVDSNIEVLGADEDDPHGGFWGGLL